MNPDLELQLQATAITGIEVIAMQLFAEERVLGTTRTTVDMPKRWEEISPMDRLEYRRAADRLLTEALEQDDEGLLE